MRKISGFGLSVVSFIMLSAINVMGDTGQDRVFTNSDLETYKKSPGSLAQAPKAERREDKKNGLKDLSDEFEKEQWCKRATVLKRKIEKAQDDVKESGDKIQAEKNAGPQKDIKKKKATERRLKRLQQDLERDNKRLKYAEKDLADLEDEAHRKRVPPGWLRCQ